jgi:hypothetical protein
MIFLTLICILLYRAMFMYHNPHLLGVYAISESYLQELSSNTMLCILTGGCP